MAWASVRMWRLRGWMECDPRIHHPPPPATCPHPPPPQTLADQGKAELVHPPKITYRDFEKSLLRARPTVGKEDLAVYEKFTAECGG